MRRSLEIPILLWIPAAILVHLGAADGGDTVAKIYGDRSALDRMGAVVRERVRASETQTLTIEGIEAPPIEVTPPEDPLVVEAKKKEEKKKEELAAIKKEELQREKKKLIDLKIQQEQKKVEPPPQMLQDKRIAVKQRAQPNQDDNPNAAYLSEEANHVKEETAATQTSLDQDDPDPTPGGNKSGSDPKMGDSDRTKIAQNEDKAGEKDRAPGDKGTEFTVDKDQQPKPAAMAALQVPAAQPNPAGGDQKTAPTPTPSPSPQPAPAPVAPIDAVAEGGAQSGWSFNPIRPGATGGLSANPAQGHSQDPRQRTPNGPIPILGLGGTAGPGQVNLNITQQNVIASVGVDQLRKERLADGERRKSEHRGSWVASNFERWRTAIENYVSAVRPGNQTALNSARSPFATYLHAIHNRIHPIFADSFLGSLEQLPKTHPLNDPKLITRLEIVLTKEGQIVKMGIVKTSGMTAFDVAALDSVQRASPFGPPPSAIVSPDNRVYLHWEFHRDEVFACSTMNARPFILNVPAGTPPSDPAAPPRGPTPPRERERMPTGPLDNRQGSLDPHDHSGHSHSHS